ncbi:hypothetical protein [Streptosporangium lutulentum]|uniref:Uncharacterized protein n=1 Tax=Streptosporangium lutulentum TaxID=1461250 RepID=A0ABT9QVN8_9ACTN|nr:hypothetical protein [Streptosporangium lutulentum]MDP9850476.1 hypothetical protein [Streptosporangium lutulentum]
MGEIKVGEQSRVMWVAERRTLVGTPSQQALDEADDFIDRFWPDLKVS